MDSAGAGSLTARRRENAPRFVQPQRLAAQSALRGDLTDELPVALHEGSLQLAPWGNVKDVFGELGILSAMRCRGADTLTARRYPG